MKIYIIAGEASGDLHGANLIKALKEAQPAVQCRVWGGDLMRAAGGDLVKHYRDLAFMGFVEVLKNLRTIMGNLRFCKRDVLDYKPDVLVLIDYPGFNLRIAKWAKREGIKVVYYISPQIWAWHRSRVYDIKRDVDKMLVILPFETDFYRQYGVEAVFVGHPLLDALVSPPPAPEPLPLTPEPSTLIALQTSRITLSSAASSAFTPSFFLSQLSRTRASSLLLVADTREASGLFRAIPRCLTMAATACSFTFA